MSHQNCPDCRDKNFRLSSHKLPRLSRSELGTVLAALRFWQTALEDGTVWPGSDYMDVATDGGTTKLLPAHEIDDLCERINQ